ncbi:XRE family transcriptional regulator [Megasphaera cerevisiae DSM 20462]|jgi:two-component system KDP operon response regulator KdpE|uniref:XRE family transcriptional regulator n=1 Tax=Megasphaera cerevisiae DSM 20462 TaxID=1122219 RepID=A0A0J6WT77_9FIRM|nr:response regulator transcription factor [Megasphaera cerevisiae]KMO86725.1 XRE family transcriptional regulator [Megasphaera cerevisiae DSM 20462]MCI1751266.1 response regulator transcription factor [Megasphaera cerevisiae]OKY52486.1 DNA-binding response regulator [Megasphaera cerevisiae]SJZ93760.1 two-component system, OmpR family, KDP operon response regulator KdpE [Megasphaera cerevisiae DSM 20462]
MNKPSLLIVEDDAAVRNLIASTLKLNDYKFHIAKTGAQALLEAASYLPDIILLDLGLPDMDGVTIIKKVRSWSALPIIVISARSEDKDKIDALDAGADDYITKPFSVEELLARIRVSVRRLQYSQMTMQQENSVFSNGDLKIDYQAGCVYCRQKEIHLTPIEYKLLCLLARNVGKVLTHTYITREIWGNAWESNVASLRVFMATLRKKIEKDAANPEYIQTHIGIGYRMLRIEENEELL